MGWTSASMTTDRAISTALNDLTWTSEEHAWRPVEWRRMGTGRSFHVWLLASRTDLATKEVHHCIGLILFEATDGNQVAWKHLDEPSGPFTYDCPLPYLERADLHVNASWREKVRAHAHEHPRCAVGQVWELPHGCSPATLTIVSTRPLCGSHEGQVFKFPRAMLKQSRCISSQPSSTSSRTIT